VEFGASSIDVQILCYMAPVNLTEFTAIKQNLIYEIMRVVRENGSEFAYPSTSLYVESTPESVDNAIPSIAEDKSE
jgi:MscS family membrane protein